MSSDIWGACDVSVVGGFDLKKSMRLWKLKIEICGVESPNAMYSSFGLIATAFIEVAIWCWRRNKRKLK